jgi:hypothetical protein
MGLRYFIPRDFIEDDYDIEKEYEILDTEYQEPAFDDWRIEA